MPSRLAPLYLLGCLLAASALAALWYALGRAVPLADAPARLQCASYTPFASDQSPFQQPFVLRSEQVDADLALLARRFRCIRTYSMLGFEEIPALARKHGLKMLLGAWVSADATTTRQEIEALVASANAYPEVVEALIVGNETLLRKEVTASQLTALIGEVRQRVRQPVSYADVWEFWLRHAELAPAVDFLTIHLLPYWEDQPHGIDQALEQVADVRREFGQRFAPKDILIGEIGWPSQGRQRETARPGRVEEARFVRGFIDLAQRNGWRYNLIEAFDQPWKRHSEGAVGGYWGLYDAERQDKGILAGAVSDLPHWRQWLFASLLLGAASLLLAGRPGSPRAALGLPLLAALGAACLGLWGELARVASREPGEWLWALALALLNLVVLAHAMLALAARQGWRQRLFDWLEQRGAWWLGAAGFAGAVAMLALVFDPRYRDFPSAALLLPGVVYLCRAQAIGRRESALLAALIGAGIIPQLLQETLANQQALAWALVAALLAGALLRGRAAQARA